MTTTSSVLDDVLIDIDCCPLCGGMQYDAETTPPANLYSEQIAILVGSEEAEVLAAVTNRRCTACGTWYKPRWFRPEVLSTLFTERVPGHPKGWDAVSDRFSEAGFARELLAYRHAVDSGVGTERARYRRSLSSIVDSIVSIDETSKQHLLEAIAEGDVDALEFLRHGLDGHFKEPAAFKRFSGFSSRLLWDWMESYLGPVRRYGELGCPLWGQLSRPASGAEKRYFFDRAENNYWGAGCRQGGRHCSRQLAATSGDIEFLPWPPSADLRLDALGAFQYLDHLEAPAAFADEIFRCSRALLLILDAVDAPVAIQHFSGWDDRSVAWLAREHGKQVVNDFEVIHASGNRAWLLFDD